MKSATFMLIVVLAMQVAHAQEPTPPSQAAGKGCKWIPVCSTPGAQLTLKEEHRDTVDNKPNVFYSLHSSGLPPNKIYTLWGNAAGQGPNALFTGFAADPSGVVVCLQSQPPGLSEKLLAMWCLVGFEKVEFGANNYAYGEPYKLALISLEGDVAAYGTAYPFPIDAKDKGCRLWLERIDKEAHAFAVWFEGFEVNETVKTKSQSGKEVLEKNHKVSASGTSFPELMIVSPGVKGQDGGNARYTVTGKACEVSVDYGWGRNAGRTK